MPSGQSFEWTGSDDLSAIVAYSKALGARDTKTTSGAAAACVLPLSREEAGALVASCCPK